LEPALSSEWEIIWKAAFWSFSFRFNFQDL